MQLSIGVDDFDFKIGVNFLLGVVGVILTGFGVVADEFADKSDELSEVGAGDFFELWIVCTILLGGVEESEVWTGLTDQGISLLAEFEVELEVWFVRTKLKLWSSR